MNLIGQTLGQYRIIEPIGTGGMATVYKAFQPGLDRYVAIKVLPAQHALTPGFKERFMREAKAVARLSHPNILPIHDVGFEGDLSFFVMKYVPDRTLGHLLGRSMPLPAASRYIEQVAGALDHAHEQGILHRDVKPANMLLEGDWLLLADFGLAKIVEGSIALTATGAVIGTPAYVSPEQAEGKPVDHRTDIYSLGIVLYEMVTGRVPYEGETPMGIMFKHVYEPLPLPRSLKPDLPEAVERVVLKALAKNPADRYDRAGQLAGALRQAVSAAEIRREDEETRRRKTVEEPESTVVVPGEPPPLPVEAEEDKARPAVVEPPPLIIRPLPQPDPSSIATSTAYDQKGDQEREPAPSQPEQMLSSKPAKQSSYTRWYWTGLLVLLGLGICIGAIIFFNTPKDVYDYEYRGRSYADSGDLEQALLEFNKAVELDPDYVVVWNLLCWYGGLSGRAADFMEACERAVELAPDDGNIRDSRGLARALTGDYEGAIEDFEYFVQWSKETGEYEDRRPRREAWIVELEAGRNPFDEATLEALRVE